MRNGRLVGTLVLWLLAAASTGCEGVKELLALRNGLAETFQTPEVGVNLTTGGTLTVMLQNSPLDGQEGAVEQAACREVAEYVRDHFGRYSTVRTVQVAFATQRGLPGVSITQSRTPCSFTHRELGEPRVKSATTDSARAAA